MDINFLDPFKRVLLLRRERLLNWLNASPHKQQFLCQDKEESTIAKTDVPVVDAIEVALERIERGDFGHCTQCDGEVEPERLELDFTTCVCLDHYTESQIRELERDLELAARVQQHLFPCCVPALNGVEIAAYAEPARIVGGDYYDFFPYKNNTQGVIVADVMGDGLPASMLMANLQASLRILGPEYEAPHALAGRLNTLFQHNLRLIRFISMVLLAVDVERGLLHYSNAGHPPPLHWDAAAKTARWLMPTGPALGLMPTPDMKTETIRFGPHDLVLLYTDGLVEARSPDGEEFGQGRIEEYLRKHRNKSAEDILAGVRRKAREFTAGGIKDDLALLVVKRHA